MLDLVHRARLMMRSMMMTMIGDDIDNYNKDDDGNDDDDDNDDVED